MSAGVSIRPNCHPRESGDPATARLRGEKCLSKTTCGLSQLRSRTLARWVPAFAGMTSGDRIEQYA
jgi:hypothetical protein